MISTPSSAEARSFAEQRRHLFRQVGTGTPLFENRRHHHQFGIGHTGSDLAAPPVQQPIEPMRRMGGDDGRRRLGRRLRPYRRKIPVRIPGVTTCRGRFSLFAARHLRDPLEGPVARRKLWMALRVGSNWRGADVVHKNRLPARRTDDSSEGLRKAIRLRSGWEGPVHGLPMGAFDHHARRARL